MEDLNKITVNTLDKYNQLQISNAVYMDKDTGSIYFNGGNVTPIVGKEFEAIHNYYKRYRMYLIEGGGCVSCRMQKLNNVERDYKEFLKKLKTKYFEGE